MKKKRHLRKQAKIVLSLLCAALIALAAVFAYRYPRKKAQEEAYASLVPFTDTLDVEYGSEADPSVLFPEGTAVQMEEPESSAPGTYSVNVTASKEDAYGVMTTRTSRVNVHIADTTGPLITLNEGEYSCYAGDLDAVKSWVNDAEDALDGTLEFSETLKKGTWSVDASQLSEAGEKDIEVKAEDSSGNVSTAVIHATLIEKPYYPYYIRINRAANVVNVYIMDAEGNYTVPYTAFVCSTGTDTPLGTYQTSVKYRWRALFGGVYGQYATRIVGDILFHSVPYYAADPSMLESEEYNKLGTAASMGCIRLCVRDVLWVYENCPSGTTVEFYDDADNPGPLGKPEPITIDLSDARAGWDPTDPDPANPWNS